uniref:Uncharacterized protein n=1 Tax=Oryza punctata TaxID=4537 RepID=A0A0E0L4Q1_ORYPU
MEEFQEADVLWPDHHHHQHLRRDDGRRHQELQHGVNDDASRGGGGTSSAPVGIPVTRAPTSTAAEHEAASWATRISHGSTAPAPAAFVPPHELVAARARRCSEERAAFSVCVGNGRTLKGRDLRDVRTAVLRMTGFLET